MAKRSEIFNKIVSVVKDSDKFKEVYAGVAPTWSNIRMFPACAILIDREDNTPRDYTCVLDREVKVLFLIYEKYKTNEYGDKVGDLLEDLEDVLNSSDELQSLTTYYYPESVLQDGGILYPFTMAELKLNIQYRH